MEAEHIEQLVQLVKKGDKQPFAQIVNGYQKQLYHYIFCILNNPQDTEDVLQETFITALRKINQYRANTQFSAWLYRIQYTGPSYIEGPFLCKENREPLRKK